MSSPALQKFTDKLAGLKSAGDGWVGKCPAHQDDHASLSISEGDDGRVLVHCHAGCKTADILNALGFSLGDLFPPRDQARSDRDPIATYQYRDLDGELMYEVLRFRPKDFRQRRPDGAGGWIWRMKGVRYLPYRLNELRNIETVVIVEGEKDADRLWSLGIPATTNAGGAGKWRQIQSKILKDAGCRRIVVVPDNDAPGQKHAEDVATVSRREDLAVSIIPLPGVPEHGDVSDWFGQGHTVDELAALIAATPYVVPRTAEAAPAPLTSTIVVAPAGPDALADPTAYAPSGGDGIPYDAGAARAFRDRYGDRVRWDHTQKRWLVWDQHFWRPDWNAEVDRLAKRHVALWQQEAMASTGYVHRRALVNFALKLDSQTALESMLRSAKSELPISTQGTEWDQDNWVLGCPNGVLDLRTGELRDGRREDWITRQVAVPYDPAATCPRWEKFIGEIFCDDEFIMEYIKLALGYSLTGDSSGRCFFMCLGDGANGKSVFLNAVEHVWGSYARRAKMTTFVGGDGSDKFDLWDFNGRRLILASETKPRERMNEHILKQLTGDETIVTERKYADDMAIKPVCKIWFAINHEPRVRDDSAGFWERVRLVRFEQSFIGEKRDPHLIETLRDEAPGILAWAVRGCLDWCSIFGRTLPVPYKILAATAEFQEHEDPLAEFMGERTELDDGGSCTFTALYAEYREWAKANGLSERAQMSAKAVGQHLKRKGYTCIEKHPKRYVGLKIVRPPTDRLDFSR
jgi:putative DNA primase/helicase